MTTLIQEIRAMLYPSEKFALLRISFLTFIASLLELCGIGLVMPIIALFLTPALFEQNQCLILLKQLTGNLPYDTMLIIFCMATALFFILKNIFLFIVTRQQIRFSYSIAARLGSELLKRYIGGDYRYQLKDSFGSAVEKIQRTRGIVPTLLNSLIMLFSESVLIFILLVSLFVLAPYTALGIAGFIILFSPPLYLLMTFLLRNIAERDFELSSHLTSFLLFTLNALREVKLANRMDCFIEKGYRYEYAAVKPQEQQFLFSQIPRFAIELAVILLGMGTIVLLLFYQVAPTTIALQISFTGLALIRMMPSASRIHYYLAHIRSQKDYFRKIFEDLSCIPLEQKSSKHPLTFEHELRIEDLTFSYGEKTILKQLSLTIPKNSSLALSGQTGCGKTTLSDLIAGLFPPDSGRILVDGRDIHENLESWRAQLGYVPQVITLLEGTIAENVALGVPVDQIDRTRVAECLKIAQAEDFVLCFPNGIDHILVENGRNLSGGQRQRLGIARALYTRPSFLIFDEATSALDNETEAAFIEALSSLRGKVTILVVAHRKTSLEYCDRVFHFPVA